MITSSGFRKLCLLCWLLTAQIAAADPWILGPEVIYIALFLFIPVLVLFVYLIDRLIFYLFDRERPIKKIRTRQATGMNLFFIILVIIFLSGSIGFSLLLALCFAICIAGSALGYFLASDHDHGPDAGSEPPTDET